MIWIRRDGPTVWLFSLLAFCISNPLVVPGINLSLVQISAIAVVIAWMFDTLSFGRMRTVSNWHLVLPLLVGAGLVAAVALASGLRNNVLGGSLDLVFRYLLGIGVLVAGATTLTTEKRVLRVLKWLVTGAVVAAVIAFSGNFVPALGEITIGPHQRVRYLFQHANQFAMVLAATIPLSVLFSLRRGTRTLGLLATIAIVVALLYTGSLMNQLMAIVGVAMLAGTMWLRHGKRRMPLILLYGSLLSVALVGVLTIDVDNSSLGSDRIRYLIRIAQGRAPIQLNDELASIPARFDLYRQVLDAVQDRPLLGVGGDDGSPYLVEGKRTPSHAHNMFMNQLLLTGTLGLIATVIFAFGWLQTTVVLLLHTKPSGVNRAALLPVALGVSLVVFFLSNQASDSLGGLVIYLAWLLLAAAIGLTRAPQLVLAPKGNEPAQV